MKQNKTNFLKGLFILLTVIVGVNFSSNATVFATETEEVVVTDMTGREVTLDAPATEIVTLEPSNAEILFALDAGDTIVGRGEFVDYPAEEVEDIPLISTMEGLNVEEVIALAPEVVILTPMGDMEAQINQLEEAGIKVVITEASTIEEVYESITLLGDIVGKPEEAEEVINEMQATFDEYSEMASEVSKESPSIYYEISPLEFGLWTGGQNTFMQEIGDMLNLENVFADVDGWVEVSEEQVLERNPEYIITTTMPMENMDPVEEILGRDGWDTIAAIENENVFQANSDEFTRPGPRLADAIKTLYDYVYGQ